MDESPKLKRAVSLPLVIFYGLGTILGAGIYVLAGKVAITADIYTPFSFLLSAIIALFTAFSYAELSARFPKSAGEAVYVYHGFKRQWFSSLIGWMVVFTGVVSAATLINGVVGYVQTFIPLSTTLIIITLTIALSALAAWGIKESAITATIITLIEIAGLLFVLFVSKNKLLHGITHISGILPPLKAHIWSGILSGAFLAFYAFIGFEDMVNIAEEVVKPEKNLPAAILWALGAATLLYILVAITAIYALPISELIQSKAPLATIIQHAGYSPAILGIIGSIAVINGALIQIIMASRVIYGMGKHAGAPKVLSKINPHSQTPIIATILVMVIVLVLALFLPLITLAKTTSFIILCVFASINLALVFIKIREKEKPHTTTYSIIMPVIGFITCLVLIAFY